MQTAKLAGTFIQRPACVKGHLWCYRDTKKSTHTVVVTQVAQQVEEKLTRGLSSKRSKSQISR